MMKKLAIVILALAASLSAADFSGVWNGTGGKVGTLEVRNGSPQRRR